MARKNILDLILLLKIVYFYITVFFVKLLMNKTDDKYKNVFIECLGDLRNLKDCTSNNIEFNEKIKEIRTKIDNVFPKPNKCF